MIESEINYTSLTSAEILWVQQGAAGELVFFSDDVVVFPETTAPSPEAGFGKLYVKSSDSLLYFKDDSGTEYSLTVDVSGANTALSNLASVAINTALLPGTSDSIALGSATKMWSDLFLGDLAVINFNNGDVTLTHGSNVLTLAGGDLALGANNLTMTGSLGATGARLTAGWFTDLTVTNAITGAITGNAGTATALLNARTIGGVSFDGTANITVSSATGGFTVSGGDLALGANNITMSGSLAATGTRVTKGWFTDLEITNSPTVGGTAISAIYLALAGGTLAGNITFGENTAIVHDPVLSADGKYCGIVRAGTAGAALAFGDLVYLAAVDSRWELADASAASTAGDVLIGMCVLAAASDGDPTTILLQGFIRADTAFPALTISAPAYISEVAGDIVTAQPTTTDAVIRRVGFAWTADELYFNPSNDYITHT